MNANTAIRTRVLASMNLSKVIVPESYEIPIVRNNAIVGKKDKVIYRATVSGNDEYKDIVGVGRTEMDAFKKLNDSLFSTFKVRHSDKYNEIVNEIKKEKAASSTNEDNSEENKETAKESEDSTSAENAA